MRYKDVGLRACKLGPISSWSSTEHLTLCTMDITCRNDDHVSTMWKWSPGATKYIEISTNDTWIFYLQNSALHPTQGAQLLSVVWVGHHLEMVHPPKGKSIKVKEGPPSFLCSRLSWEIRGLMSLRENGCTKYATFYYFWTAKVCYNYESKFKLTMIAL